MPRYHQSPTLMRVAAAFRQRAERAERAERSMDDLHQQHSSQTLALAAAQQEIADLHRQLTELRNAHGAKSSGLEPPSEQLPGGAGGTSGGGSGGRPPNNGRGPRQTGASSERPIDDLRARLRNCQQMYQEVMALAGEQQRSLDREQSRRTELEAQLHDVLALAVRKEPPHTQAWDDESAAHVQQRAAIVTTELAQLRRHRDLILAERERLSARLLSLLTPGQSSAHASKAGYQAATDPLIPLKRDELILLDAYAVWQSQHMRHVTARTMDPNKPLDEQALDAAIAARWALLHHPPLEVRNLRQPPRWVVVGCLLNEPCERYLIGQAQRRMAEINQRMGTGNDNNPES